ncbi:MAG: hypothetical protein ACFB5Z_12905, partial [Elainellaceae cyanobacterium]
MADNILNMDDFNKVYPDSVDPVLTQAFQREVRMPNSHAVDETTSGRVPALHVSELKSTPLHQAQSMLGHNIVHPAVPPWVDLEDALERLLRAARQAGNAALSDLSAAHEACDILLGRTQGRFYDGFGLLNYNVSPELPGQRLTADHVPGEYKMKTIQPTGRTTPNPVGVERPIWEVTVNSVWYGQNFDSDIFLLQIPVEAEPTDTVEIHWRIYSLIQEDLAPATVLNDGFGRIFHGLDSSFLSLPPRHLSEITTRTIPNLRGIYNWGWGVHPPRVQFIQPVERTRATDKVGTVEPGADGVGWDPLFYSFVKRNRDLTLAMVSAAAPEKKAYRVAQAAIAGEQGALIVDMLTDGDTPPRGLFRQWMNLASDQRRLPDEAWDMIEGEPGVDRVSGKIGKYDVVHVYMNNKAYGVSASAQPNTEGKGATVRDFDQGDVLRVKVVNLDNHTHYYRNVDFGAQFVKETKKTFGNGKFSFEKFSAKPTYGVPKVVEMQWRTGWGYVPHRGVAQQGGVFPRDRDREQLAPFTDQFGNRKYGYQFTSSANGFYRFNPPDFIRAGFGHPDSSESGPDPISGVLHTDFTPGTPLRDADGRDGIKIGKDTEGFGVAQMPDGPYSHPNPDTGNNLPPSYPPFLSNDPNAAGGDIIPPTP